MSRYLTPSKIGLLALIALYTDGIVPSSATIPVLAFLVSQILPFHSAVTRDQHEISLHGFTVSVEQFRRATITLASAIPGRTLWDLLLGKLWNIHSHDALHVFFDDLPMLLERPTSEDTEQRLAKPPTQQKRMLLSRNSPLGTFVRRAQLEFTRLQFHDGIILWKSLILFREPTFALWKRRNPSPGINSLDCNLHEDAVHTNGRLSWILYGDLAGGSFQRYNDSTDDMENLLEYQVSRMQSWFTMYTPGRNNEH